jgi:tetratricopeptide (TPR) repeat protein
MKHPTPLRGLALLGVLITCCCGRSVAAAAEPIYDGLGSYTRAVTTKSPEAQKYFNQGLAFLHGFNHGAAIRSFQEAARLDPGCAMAHWAIALAAGPHINLPMVPPPMAELAWKELTLARQNAEGASPLERELIDALGKRYANPQPEDRAPLDVAYADAMREVWKRHPDDQDVGAWFAESMMDLRPWNQWTLDGQANPGTDEVLATLDAVLKLNINHPFANHLYIHAVEASPHPERADAAAARLLTLQPNLAHNVHMPSHIDIRRGRWQQSIETNTKAIEADAKHRAIAGPPQGLLIFYAAHNQHMLSFSAMMTGQSALSIQHIREMETGVPEDFIKQFALMAEGLRAMPDEVLVRFGKWDEILAEPDSAKDYTPFTNAFHHAARAIAFAAKGDPKSARAEQRLYLDGITKIPAEATMGQNHVKDVCAVATPMLEGEILVREGKTDEGIARLRDAIKLEDTLHYIEPPDWMIPVRHSLGAVLMKAGKFADAEQLYREDLKRLPENGWSLYGLAESLRRQGRVDEAATFDARFQKIWANADLKIHSSCLCQPGVASTN